MKRTKQSTEVRLCKVCGQPLPKEYHISRTMHPDCANEINRDHEHIRKMLIRLNPNFSLRNETNYDKRIKQNKRKSAFVCSRCGMIYVHSTLCRQCNRTWNRVQKAILENDYLCDKEHPSKILCISCHKPVDEPYRLTCSKCRRDYANGKIPCAQYKSKLKHKIPKFTAEQKRVQDELLVNSKRYKGLFHSRKEIEPNHPLAQFLPASREHKTDVKPDPVTRRSKRRDIETGNVWIIEQRGQCFSYLQKH